MHALLLAAAIAAAPTPIGAPEERPVDVLAWFRMSPPEYGCWLEKTFGHRDPRWNCDLKGWKWSGDPCVDVDGWLEGPAFPDALARRVHPKARAIRLEWEHGDLRAVTIQLEGAVSEAAARRALRLPPAGAPEGFSRVDLQQCSKRGPCLTIERFEHMGAGETDCGDAR